MQPPVQALLNHATQEMVFIRMNRTGVEGNPVPILLESFFALDLTGQPSTTIDSVACVVLRQIKRATCPEEAAQRELSEAQVEFFCRCIEWIPSTDLPKAEFIKYLIHFSNFPALWNTLTSRLTPFPSDLLGAIARYHAWLPISNEAITGLKQIPFNFTPTRLQEYNLFELLSFLSPEELQQKLETFQGSFPPSGWKIYNDLSTPKMQLLNKVGTTFPRIFNLLFRTQIFPMTFTFVDRSVDDVVRKLWDGFAETYPLDTLHAQSVWEARRWQLAQSLEMATTLLLYAPPPTEAEVVPRTSAVEHLLNLSLLHGCAIEALNMITVLDFYRSRLSLELIGKVKISANKYSKKLL